MNERNLRSWLLIADDSEARFAAAMQSGADVVILDSRRVDLWYQSPLPMRERAPRLAIKVGEATEEDLEASMAAAPWAILASCRCRADVQRLGGRLAVREARLGLTDGATRIVACVFDAKGVLNLSSFADASPRLAALTWDEDALKANLYAPRAKVAPALARGLLILAAAAADVAAIDGPAALSDFRAQAENAREEGFCGKFASTPEQVAILNAVFAPAP